jgi:hypothetical protein
MKLQPALIQFIHPGREFIPTSRPPDIQTILNPWNTGPHLRKFIKTNGLYVSSSVSNKTHAAVIGFWGEWEPQSHVSLLNKIYEPGFPRYIHTPFLQVPSVFKGHQNTDPFIFGDHFHYVCCQQYRGGHASKLRHLDPGSVIFFGSRLDGGFVLDTVFVVSERYIDIDEHTYQSLPDKGVSRAYFDISIRPIFEQIIESSCMGTCDKPQVVCPPKPFRLYFGATIKEPYQGMYSFFPCLPFDGNPNGFKRPVINHSSINPELRQGWKALQTNLSNAEFWKVVAGIVENQGLSLGVFAQLP